MIAEFLAGLRGFMGTAGNTFSDPWFLFCILLAIYVLWRRTSRA
jgi:hypothetical protein